MMPESGRICLVRPSAVIITHKKWVSGETLEKFIHKDRPSNVGCFHYRVTLPHDRQGAMTNN
jgi:hypothetical protein